MANLNNDQIDENKDKYLLFRVGDELFGVPLMGVREVVEPQKIKPIPNTVEHFSGVINIRGEIVGVIDLRIRFNQPLEDNPLMAMIIFESAVGPMGAIVDEVDSVAVITDDMIDINPNVSSDFSLEFLIGIGKIKEKLITIVNLNEVLGAETLNSLRRTKLNG